MVRVCASRICVWPDVWISVICYDTVIAVIHLYVSVRDCELLGDSCLTHVCNFSLLSMSVIWTSWSVNVG